MLFCDGGTTYSKIMDSHSNTFTIIPTQQLLKDNKFIFEYATGHSIKRYAKNYVNELIALAEGAKYITQEKMDGVVLDVGSRDTKYVHFKSGQVVNLDWNASCGGNLGFTLEMLGNYYALDYNQLEISLEPITIACGLLGIEKIFDRINEGDDMGMAVSSFVHGIALDTYRFCGQPEKIWLSGGLINNKCFISSLEKYCKVETLGRDVLLQGLKAMMEKGGEYVG